MFSRKWNVLALGAVMFAAGFGVRGFVGGEVAHAQAATRVFEMRTYTAAPGKLAALHSRFRDHTLRLFEKHGMQNIGYWQQASGENAENTLVYILAYPSEEARKKSWEAFGNDPEWKKAKADSEKDGVLVAKVESKFMKPTDYSTIK